MHVEEFDIALAKGHRSIKLDPSFKPGRLLGALFRYGTLVGGQPMMNWGGNYQADFGLGMRIDTKPDGTIEVEFYASGSYPSIRLIVMVFYQ